ncbi:transcriptional regulator [Clostridium sp. L74]|nr:transcriptional regulator [Clostridium sp. L74]
MEICERLQKLRKLSNYSQEQLANMISASRQAISKWESGNYI